MESPICRLRWLPEEIIQLILSYLNVEEQARACVVSKDWLNAWLNKPSLEFDHVFFTKRTNNSSTHNVRRGALRRQFQQDCRRRFKNYVSSTLGRYGDRIQELNLAMFLTGPADNLLIDRWLGIAVEKGVKVLRISIEKTRSQLIYTLPEKIFTSLTELSINYRCQFPDQVRGLHAPALNNKLKKLSLKSTRLSPTFFSTLVNKFPNLEFLKVDSCLGFGRIKLVSHSLKHIEIIYSFSDSKIPLEKVEFDTPSLTFLEIRFDELEILTNLSFATNCAVLPKNQAQMVCRLSCICQSDSGSFVNASWFIKLNKMLSDLTPSRVSLHIMYPVFPRVRVTDDLSFPLQGCAAAVDVEILKLTLNSRFSSIRLASCLFWACRPKTLVLRFFDDTINYLFCFLSDSRIASDRFGSSWMNGLREAKLFNQNENKWQQLQQPLTSSDPSLSSATEWSEIRIALDWDVPSDVGLGPDKLSLTS